MPWRGIVQTMQIQKNALKPQLNPSEGSHLEHSLTLVQVLIMDFYVTYLLWFASTFSIKCRLAGSVLWRGIGSAERNLHPSLLLVAYFAKRLLSPIYNVVLTS